MIARLLTILFMVSLPGSVGAEGLSVVKDKFLVDLFNGVEILAEVSDIKKSPYVVRLFRLQDHGECDGTPQSCPQQALYIAVSTFGEAPDQNVFELPKSYGWEFSAWKSFPKNEGKDSFVTITLNREVIAKDLSKAWWTKLPVEIQVNPWKGSLKEMKQ